MEPLSAGARAEEGGMQQRKPWDIRTPPLHDLLTHPIGLRFQSLGYFYKGFRKLPDLVCRKVLED